MTTPDDTLPVNVQTTEYRVSCLPLDDTNAYHFSVTVEWRGDDRWAVCWGSRRCLGTDGGWDYESIPSEREDEWLASHRFDQATALVLAAEAAQHLTVNGFTVQDALARRAGTETTR